MNDCPQNLIALENRPGAHCIYDFRPLAGESALVAGNEAKGLRRSTLKRATALVEIPVVSRNINCLNVAAAAAIALRYLLLPNPLPYPARTAEAIRKNRPALLVVGGKDHMELGSSIRSACAFGWDRVYLEDRFDAWYRCARLIKSEGRGAARRGRNPIRVIPWPGDGAGGFDRIVEIAGLGDLQERRLIGPRTLIVLRDNDDGTLCFRQSASIVMAEVARQLGRFNSAGVYLRGRKDRYRKSIEDPRQDNYCLEDFCLF